MGANYALKSSKTIILNCNNSNYVCGVLLMIKSNDKKLQLLILNSAWRVYVDVLDRAF